MELKELLEQVLREREGLSDLEVSDVREVPCTKPGDNYMSVVNVVEVTGSPPGGAPYSTSVFVKRPPDSAERRQAYQVEVAFHNEAVMYLQVLPLYDVPVACAHCFYADSDVIMLQDLLREGYSMGERTEGLDLHTTTHVLEALARFHAASYHTRFVKEEDFAKATSHLKVLTFFQSRNQETVATSVRRGIDHLAGVPDLEGVLPFLRRLQGSALETAMGLREAKEIAVLCHGDFWINNLLLRGGDDDPVRIVDLQACSLLSPAVDVWSLLYTSVNPTLLEQHAERFLQVYSGTFLDVLTSLKIPPERIPSLKDLLEDLTSRELYGFLVATVYLPAVYLSNIPDLDTVTKEQTLDDKFLDHFVVPALQHRMCDVAKLCMRRKVFDKLP